MQIVISKNIPQPKGHYSPCITHNGIVYVSGQLPFHPKTREIPEGIEKQTWQVLQNLELILNEAGSSTAKVLQMRIYIPKMEMWDLVNKIYAEFFGAHKPVRCIVPTRELHYGCLIEIEATAFVEQ
ncbi:MAG: RidA family protein [Cyclobacteriaceae bacterium]